MGDFLIILMRWLHIFSMMALIGGFYYWRFVLVPALESIAPAVRDQISAAAASRFKPIVMTSVAGLVISGTYNLLTNPGHTPRYHMMFGIKILLALHVFAVAFLITKPVNPRRSRMLTGAILSGLIILVISAYLRRIF